MAEGATPKVRRTPRRKAPTTADPIEIAMETARDDGAAARRLLVRQEALVGWEIADRRAAFALKVLGVVAALAAAAMLGFMVWNASRADGLVIKAFSVPPSMAAKGVTGEALAAQMMDRLNEISRAARSPEAQRRLAGDWGQNISIQIPETGVSISQVDQWLRDRLGREKRVTGELMEGPDGRLVLAARSGAFALPEQSGTAADLPAMLQRTAEALSAHEQPNTYGSYLINQQRWDEQLAFSKVRIASRSRSDQAAGYGAMATALNRLGDRQGARAAYQRALAIDPRVATATIANLGGIEAGLGHTERSRQLNRQQIGLLKDRSAFVVLSPQARRQRLLSVGAADASYRGDFQTQASLQMELSKTDLLGYAPGVAPRLAAAAAHARLHDFDTAQALIDTYQLENDAQKTTRDEALYSILLAREDWAGALANRERQTSAGAPTAVSVATMSLLLARSGRLAEGLAMVEPTPLDCAPCVRARGVIAALGGDARISDHWFEQAVRMAPSAREGPYEWGQALLASGSLRDPAPLASQATPEGGGMGETGRAIAQFKAAHDKAPKWAEPLAGWGEALLAKGDEAGAIGKFRQAGKIAPQWGRLHLKWGAALAKTGKAEAARAHWKTASGLYLTAAERAELERLLR